MTLTTLMLSVLAFAAVVLLVMAVPPLLRVLAHEKLRRRYIRRHSAAAFGGRR